MIRLTFNVYQEIAKETAIYPHVGENIVYPTLGLCGEAGEVAEKVKKLFRDHGGKLTPEYIESIKKELGDVLWYISAIANELGIDLNSIAATNLAKLVERKQKNALNGNGDNR